MCTWSKWQFICDGRFDILLAILLAAAALVALTMIFLAYLRNKETPGEFLARAMQRIKENRHALFRRKSR